MEHCLLMDKTDIKYPITFVPASVISIFDSTCYLNMNILIRVHIVLINTFM